VGRIAELGSLGDIEPMKFSIFIVALFVCVHFCGCATRMTIDEAQGNPKMVNTDGKLEPTRTPHPAYYALVPFAFVGDVAATPFAMIYLPIYGIMCGGKDGNGKD